ncbi:MAG: molybdenum cofactor guanylyltransferase [Chloroflexi bacterium]|nr:molybdenum cofactor guanylyltransferase [Chloroflexota bacterium]
MNSPNRACPRFTVAIIAGGQSSRMGRDKAFLELGGQTLIERVVAAGAGLGQSETILITNKPDEYRHLELPMYTDVIPGKGSLGGIYSALARATNPAALVLACDMPFVKTGLLRFMIAQLDQDTDIVVPRVDGYPQAMHAIYRKTCLAPIRAQLDENRLKIIRFYDKMRVTYLDEADYAPYDPEGLSFTNLNTPAELERARRLIE